MPKPIIQTHGTYATVDADPLFPSVPGHRNLDSTLFNVSGKYYAPFPPFHIVGFIAHILIPIYTSGITVFGAPSRPPSASLVAEVLQQQTIRALWLPPVLIEQMLHDPLALSLLKKVPVVCFSGGPLGQAAGDELVKYTNLCQIYGSTEMTLIKLLFPEKEDWDYMYFHPNLNLEFQPSTDDSFELVVFPDENSREHLGLNHNFPNVKEWRTKDLFIKHPTKPVSDTILIGLSSFGGFSSKYGY